MSIPANKADNKTPAYDIKLKRTSKTRTDASIKDGLLEDGEPLYNKQDKTLSIGDSLTTVENLPVVHFVSKAKSEVVTYYTAQANNMVQLQKEDGTSVYGKTKYWTTGEEVCLNFNTSTGWQYYNGTDWVTPSPERKPTTVDVQTYTIRQKLPVTGVTAQDKVCISIHLSEAQKKESSKARAAEKVFATIAKVESYDGGIYVYCKKVRTDMSCYLTVFGG